MRSQDWKQLVGRIIHGNICHWLVTKESSIFSARRSSSFRILCCALGRFSKNPQSNDAWEQRLGWIKSSSKYRNFDRIYGDPMEFEWKIFPGFNTLQLSEEVKSLLYRLGETPENLNGRIIFMSMFNDISCGSRDNKIEWESNANLVSLYAKRFGKGQWSFIGPGSEKKWYFISEECPLGECDKKAERMMLEFAESGHPIFRAASPLSRGRLKRLSTHYCADFGNDWDYFSHNHFCKPAQSLQSRRRDMWRVWILSRENGETRCDGTIKFLTRVESDDPANQKFLLQHNMKNELRSCHNKTNWVNSVWMQDFWVLLRMDSISWRKTLVISHNFAQWLVVNTLFQEKMKHHNRKAGSKETPKLGLYWKLQPVMCTVNMELRSELCLWTKTTLTLGSEFLMDRISLWWIWTTMKQKFPKISSKNLR